MDEWLKMAMREGPLFVITIYMLVRLVPAVERLTGAVRDVKTLAQVLVFKVTGEAPSEIKK